MKRGSVLAGVNGLGVLAGVWLRASETGISVEVQEALMYSSRP